MKTLTNWSVVSNSQYNAPELAIFRLHGQRPKDIENNTFCITSKIIGHKNGLILTASGSTYKLLQVLSAYEKLYPNALKRIFDNLTEIS